jgi:hypothetical protein
MREDEPGMRTLLGGFVHAGRHTTAVRARKCQVDSRHAIELVTTRFFHVERSAGVEVEEGDLLEAGE